MRFVGAVLLSALAVGCDTRAEQNYLQGLVYVPDAQTRMIKRQVEGIVGRGWGTLDSWDRLHGHLLLKPESELPRRFRSFEHLFENAVAYLYHSDEGLYRWRLTEGDLPSDKKTPRSIVYLDGKMVAAKTFFANPVEEILEYDWYGSIKSRDLAKAFPDKFAQGYDWEVDTPQGICMANLQYDVTLAQPDNPYFEINGKRLKVTMDCYPPK